MATTDVLAPRDGSLPPPAPLLCPFDLRVGRIAGFLNAELPDHPIYDGIELQRFDDPSHGSGLLVLLSRRRDRRVDYYAARGLRLDRSSYVLGGGTGAWWELAFPAARFEVGLDGVVADVRFTDVDGRRIELRVDDRAAGAGRRGVLLAPFGDGVDDPVSLPLAYVHGFDLVRRVQPAPVLRIDGAAVATGRLPGAPLHRRHLIKYGAPLTVATVCPRVDGPLRPVAEPVPGDVRVDGTGRAIAGLDVRRDGGAASLVFEPPFPDLTTLEVGRLRTGAWHAAVDDAPITGGSYHLLRRPDDRVEVGLDVTDAWVPPPGRPLLQRVVTRALPVFRRWPTTYRWRAEVTLGEAPTIVGSWTRTGRAGGETYRRATGGALDT